MAKKKDRRLRFTWTSNAHFTNSGYAVQTRDLLTRFVKDGWPLAEIGFYGLEGFPITLDGIKVYPKMNDPYGSDAMYRHSIDWGAKVAFSMQDIWTVDPKWLDALNKKNIAWIPYLPIDQEPVSPHILERIKYAYKIVSFSRFGQKALEKHGFASNLILEGTDPEIFKPLDKMKCRAELQLPADRFIFGMIAANKENPPRKGYQEILEALKLFVDNHPKTSLFIHSQQVSPASFPIKQYAEHLGIGSNIIFMNQYTSTFKADSSIVVKELNAFDVNMHASQTEGFGLGIVESQACGVPVIVNDCHSMPELVLDGKTGEVCKTNYSWWRNQLGYVHTADVKSLHDKMEILYKKLQEPNTIAKDAREYVLGNYDINDRVKNDWIPFLETLQLELLGNLTPQT